MLYCKDLRTKDIGEQRKIIIISGSNGLFSINSSIIEHVTDFPVLNLASHASLPVKYYLYQLENAMHDGDIVVMPLEYGYYMNVGNTEWFYNNMLAWGGDYLNSLPLLEKLEFMSRVSPARVIKGLLHIKSPPKIAPRSAVEQTWRERRNQPEYTSKNAAYGHKHLTYTCEFSVNGGPTDKLLDQLKTKGFAYIYKKVPHLPTELAATLNSIKTYVESRGGKFILTWPVSIRNPRFNVEDDKTKTNIEMLQNALQEHGLHIEFPPELFNLDIECFYDTWFHANYKGSAIRSVNLGACLKQRIHGREQRAWDPVLAVKARNVAELTAISPTYYAPSYFIVRRQDILKVQHALEAFHAAHGCYPASEGWQGVKTLWGKADVDWIPELTPKYIISLPADPRPGGNPEHQYLYFSNGEDYKLIAHGTEDAQAVAKLFPHLIDPKRPHAYGVWTDGAAEW